MEIKPQLVPIVVMETIIVPLAMCLILQQRRSLNKLRDLRCFSLERYQDFDLVQTTSQYCVSLVPTQ